MLCGRDDSLFALYDSEYEWRSCGGVPNGSRNGYLCSKTS